MPRAAGAAGNNLQILDLTTGPSAARSSRPSTGRIALDDLRISALAAVAILIGVQVCAWPVRASTADVHAASAGTTLVTFGQVFDTLVASASDTAGARGVRLGRQQEFWKRAGR